MEVCGGDCCKEESQVQGTNLKQLPRTRAVMALETKDHFFSQEVQKF